MRDTVYNCTYLYTRQHRLLLNNNTFCNFYKNIDTIRQNNDLKVVQVGGG